MILAAACAVVLMAFFGVWWMTAPAPLVVSRIVGEAEYQLLNGETGSVDCGAELAAGTRIRVADAGFVDLRDRRGVFQVRIGSGKVFLAGTAPRGRTGSFAFSLEEGELWVRTLAGFEGNRLMAEARELRVEITGTAFLLRTLDSDQARLDVLDGKVFVSHLRSGDARMIHVGEFLVADRDGFQVEPVDAVLASAFRAGLAVMRAPSMIVGLADYFMPSESMEPEVGLALGWDPDRAARIVQCDINRDRRLPLRLVRGASQPRSVTRALDRAAALEMQASICSDPAERAELYLEAASVLQETVEASPSLTRDGALLLYAAFLQSREAHRNQEALATLNAAVSKVRGTPLEPVAMAARGLLLADTLHRPDAAHSVFREIAERFPHAPEAVLAQRYLREEETR